MNMEASPAPSDVRLTLLDLVVTPHGAPELAASDGTVICLGNFDGVHPAHRQILREGVRVSRTALTHGLCGVFCFFKPSADYKPGHEDHPGHLTTLREKLSLFADCGVDFVCLCDFAAVRGMSPDDFISLLRTRLHCRGVVCGFNYRFGAGGVGTPDLLSAAFSHADDCGTLVLPETTLSLPGGGQTVTVSSSRIRQALAEGDPEAAAVLLGRPYSLTAPVVSGKRLGRTVGFPTANQYFPAERLVPRRGVYAVRVTLPGGSTCSGVANVGTHPTVDSHARVNCETHIIGFSGDLYGQRVTVEFLHYIRPERRFDSLDELVFAIRQDEQTAVRLLGG